MKPNLLGAALAVLLPASVAAAASPAASPVRVAEVLCDGRHDPVGVDRDAVRFSWVMESEARGQSQRAYAPAGRLEPRGAAGGPARRLGLGPRRVAATACSCPMADPRSRRRAPTSGACASRTRRDGSPPGARRPASSPRFRDASDWGEARWIGYEDMPPSRAHGARHPRPPRPGRPPEAQAAGHAAAAPRVRRAQARRAGAALRERPRALRGVPQRREGRGPIPRPGLDRLRRVGSLRRVRRDGAGALRPERAVRDRRERLPPRRAGAVLQARGRLRLAEAPRRPAARVRGRQPRDDRHRPRMEGGAVRRSPSTASTAARTSTRGSSPRTGPPPTSTTRAGAAPRRSRRRAAACGSRPITRCGSWRRGSR